MIPLLHDLRGARVLVAGGGRVGARRARRFAREATTLVVSPAFPAEDYGDAQRIRARIDPGDAAEWVRRTDPALVVAATGDEAVNGALAAAARDRGVLVNRADRAGDREVGDVAVPATVRDDPVVAAVSSGGSVPALARELRRRVEAVLDGAGGMARLAADLREEWREEHPPERRRAAVRAVVESERVWTALGRGESNARREAKRVAASALDPGTGTGTADPDGTDTPQ